MIKVNTQTLAAERISLPKRLRGLTPHTLQHLQAELDPVPAQLVNIEFWPEVEDFSAFDPATEKLGNEVLTANAGNKTVTVTMTPVPLSQEELDALQAEADRLAAIQAAIDAKADIKADTTFGTVTAAQAQTYIENNVTDLASAKAVLKKMAKFIVNIRDRG